MILGEKGLNIKTSTISTYMYAELRTPWRDTGKPTDIKGIDQ